MKKILLIAVLGILYSSVAFAEELVINLKSGNSLVIQYTGNIQGVALNGKTDAIEGLSLPKTIQDTAKNQEVAPQKQTAQVQPEKTESKTKDGKWFRLKWAEPKMED